MYVPKYAENNDVSAIIDFIKHHAFGVLVSQSEHKMVATHLPLEFSTDNTKLFGHISRANRQWKNFNNTSEVLAIFTGPHAYISSSWYDHENVPTWNYIAAHVYGKISIIEGEELYQLLKRLTDKYEAASSQPVSMEAMSAEYVRKSIHGLVGFEIAITNIEATYKLSQNRDQKNHQKIIQELEKRQDESSLKVAEEMRRTTINKI
ncbi:MAG TPA: FMN-binding negative transcriptional regulator [Chryseolinea sp.]|nr:FMN-binding negative transcriptional regulator [Chryseolinea sp.]